MADQEFTTINEIWKPIPDFPGYEVSDHGRVRSYWKRVSNGVGKGCHMELVSYPVHYYSPQIGSSGYVQTVFKKRPKYFNRRIHRLMLEVFIGPCPPGMEACHNDGNRLNNHIGNLRWDTRKNNLHDKNQHGTAPIGVQHGRAKLSEQDIIEIRQLYDNGAAKTQEIANWFNVSRENIGLIVRRKTWTHI